jgi:hypothetical protein
MFTAKYAGTCCDCDTRIAAGDSIARVTGLYHGRPAYRHAVCPELEPVEAELDLATIERQILDARRLQFNAVQMLDRSGTVSRLDAVLEDLYRRRDAALAGRYAARVAS